MWKEPWQRPVLESPGEPGAAVPRSRSRTRTLCPEPNMGDSQYIPDCQVTVRRHFPPNGKAQTLLSKGNKSPREASEAKKKKNEQLRAECPSPHSCMREKVSRAAGREVSGAVTGLHARALHTEASSWGLSGLFPFWRGGGAPLGVKLNSRSRQLPASRAALHSSP